MALSAADQLADEIAAQLSQHVFSIAITFDREHAPQHDVPDLTEPTGTVVAASEEVTAFTRGAYNHEFGTVVVVEQKLDQFTEDEQQHVDDLKRLCEEILDFTKTMTILQPEGVKWVVSKRSVPVAPETLREKRLFMAFITITHRLTK
jgi:hypothetical protein